MANVKIRRLKIYYAEEEKKKKRRKPQFKWHPIADKVGEEKRMAQSSPVIARIQQPIEGSSIGVEGRLASECIKASEWIEAWLVESIVEWAEERRRKKIHLALRSPDGNRVEGISISSI